MFRSSYLRDDKASVLLECFQGHLHEPVPDLVGRGALGRQLEVVTVVMLQWWQHGQQDRADGVPVQSVHTGGVADQLHKLLSL